MTEFVKPVLRALKMLDQAGYVSYIVGGCLRDLLLGKIPQDYDLATSATPQQTLAVFSNYRCFRLGEKFGSVGVLIDGEKFEITTFRSEFGYTDSRHPDQVVFSSSIFEDLSRRDFTINSIACGLDGKIIDPYNGLMDLNKRILRATGDPETRFGEDALRILRLFRFSAQLGFEIDRKTLDAAVSNREKLRAISKERIGAEFLRLLSYDCAISLNQMCDGNILEIIAINPIKEAKLIQDCPNDPILRLATLIFISESNFKTVNAIIRLSNIQKHLCDTFLTELSRTAYQSKTEFKRRYAVLTSDQWNELLLAKTALGQDIGKVRDYIDQIKLIKEPYQLSQLALDGDDLCRMGYEGVEIGKALEKCLIHVLAYPNDNIKEKLLKYLEQ